MKTKIEARKKTNTKGRRVSPSAHLFAVGDWVKLDRDSRYKYKVAEVRRFPHGYMIGIYDEPPSLHVDYWNPSSLTLARKGKANAADEMRRTPATEDTTGAL
jgi:hypothetical protein